QPTRGNHAPLRPVQRRRSARLVAMNRFYPPHRTASQQTGSARTALKNVPGALWAALLALVVLTSSGAAFAQPVASAAASKALFDAIEADDLAKVEEAVKAGVHFSA